MNKKAYFKIIPVIFTLGAAMAQTPAERLEEGVQLQTAEGDLDAAIEQYKEVVKSAARTNRLAAEARYRLAECFLKKGNLERMESHLEALRKDFAPDNKWVLKAETLAPRNLQFEGAPWADGNFYCYEIKLPRGNRVGQMMFAVREVKDGENPVWETLTVRTGNGGSLSSATFQKDRYQSLKSRWYLAAIGDMKCHYGNDGVIVITDGESGEEKDRYDHKSSDNSAIPVFENEQMVQMVRALNLEVGTKQKAFVFSGLNGAIPVPFNLEVTAHETIETEAGKFECAKIETNLKQTFYNARTEQREIVRIAAGPAKIDLLSSKKWDPSAQQMIEAKELGASFILPGVIFHVPGVSNDEIYRSEVYSTDFAGRVGMIEINKKSNLEDDAQKSSADYAKVLHQGFSENHDEFEVLDKDWKTMEIDGVEAVAMRVRKTMGERVEHEYQVHAVGSDLALSFRINYAQPDEDRAIARAKEIVNSFSWSQ